jgi:hypothetical protein
VRDYLGSRIAFVLGGAALVGLGVVLILPVREVWELSRLSPDEDFIIAPLLPLLRIAASASAVVGMLTVILGLLVATVALKRFWPSGEEVDANPHPRRPR